VIGNLVFDTELAELAIGKVHLNLSANPSLRADRKHIANKEHPVCTGNLNPDVMIVKPAEDRV